MTKYFKVTNYNEIHHGYVYKDGLNILDKPFEDKGSCVIGGLYFTTLDHIEKYYIFGCYLREIILPIDNPHFKMVMDPLIRGVYRANMIILGNRYSLLDINTYIKFGLQIENNENIIDLASGQGQIEVLNWWKKSGFNLKYSYYALDRASSNGQIKVLNWWKKSGLELKYSDYALDWASGNARIEILNWWKNSGLELKYSDRALNWASQNDHIEVLNWWKNSGLELKYSNCALGLASENGKTEVLNW